MASQLILILTDFFPSAQSAPSDVPRLAALETLLARSRHSALPQGWRDWLADRFATPEIAALAPAAAVARALLPPGPEQHWLATPVHYFAGLDSVHLHPDGLLQLSALEQAVLIADFQSVFADSSWRLHAIGARELLLSGPSLEASAADPAQFAGLDPSDGLPRGAQAATLRRLGAEIEMWLHEHRLNQERRARGELPVTTLWFWGALAQPRTRVGAAPIDALGRSVRLYGRDAYAQALWQLQARQAEALPTDLERALQDDARARIVLLPTLDASGLVGLLQRLEAQWFAPAMQGLRARRLRSIRLLAAASCYQLSWPQLARVWRRRRPWWEQLA
jgi:hypothetical protein